MHDIIETIIANATDPKVAFTAAAVFGYCLYKFIIMSSRRSSQVMEDPDEITDYDIVKGHFFPNTF